MKKILNDLGSVVVAYSGGVDSTFLLKVALDLLGRPNVLAVTARSATYPKSEYECAKVMARKIGARHTVISTDELKMRDFRKNPVNRCYYCKRELFGKLKEIARDNGIRHVIDGANQDDLKDIRHGRRAALEIGVRSPLAEARIGKAGIRSLSKRLALATWSKPSFACLASRIPFNHKIDVPTLTAVDKAESFIKGLGIRQVRVRAHDETARVEVQKSDFARVMRFKDAIVKRLKELGFVYVALDLAGYRTGSMHEAVSDNGG